MDTFSPVGLVAPIVKRTLLTTMAAAILLYLAVEPAWGRGLALGGVASVLNFAAMAWWLPRTLDSQRRRSEVMSLVSLVGRFALMGGALAVALVFPRRFTFAAAVVGIFSVQINILGEQMLGGLFKRRPSEG